jgi:hypothetical protein
MARLRKKAGLPVDPYQKRRTPLHSEGGPGALSFREKVDRVSFISKLLAARLSYPEIAKALAKQYDLSRKGAYLFLGRMFNKARREFTEEGPDLINVFTRLVMSLEDSVAMCKANADYKGAIAGDMALARVYGFDRGAFLEAVAAQREQRKKAKKVDLIQDSALATDMLRLSNDQLQQMLTKDDSFAEVLDDSDDEAKKARKKDEGG